ncbi:hypothetical protein D6T65_00155 [Arthrobacter frigidicola]|nr:hypothetical protein D6T65_00155 [Arthrobacter frigidicola]
MSGFKRAVAGSVLAGGMLLTAGMAPASAAPPIVGPVLQDGLVNVSVGNVTILRNVEVALAALVAANICGVDVGPVAVLGEAVDESGGTETVCTNRGGRGPVAITG